MKILVVNSGSSSLKFQFIDMPSEKVIFKGKFENIDGSKNGHANALRDVFTFVKKEGVEMIAHRVVHGGEIFRSATLINDKVLDNIEKLEEIAPLHNKIALECINECKRILPRIRQVAVFDTAFHCTIPEENFMYAIPLHYYKKYHLRKYGFHGISYKYLVSKAEKILNKKVVNIVACHLGNGSSVCAIKNSKSIDTSMGFTPLEGLMMGSRSGSIDPAIVTFIEKKEKKSADAVLDILNKKSGFIAIAGEEDFRIITERAKKGDKKSKLTINMYANQIIKYIGAYKQLIGKTDAIVLSGAIGSGLAYLRNIISKSVHDKILVIPSNEEIMIARESYKI